MFKNFKLVNISFDGLPTDEQWYIIATAFNYEQKVAQAIKNAAASNSEFKAVFLPFSYKRTTTHPKKGNPTTRITAIRGAYSGYVFVKTVMNDHIWNILHNITGIAMVMATGGVPQYVNNDELNRIKSALTFDGFTDEQKNKFLADLDAEWNHFNDGPNIITTNTNDMNTKISINVTKSDTEKPKKKEKVKKNSSRKRSNKFNIYTEEIDDFPF